MNDTAQDRPCGGKFCGRRGLPILPLRLAYVPHGDIDLTAGISAAADLRTATLRGGRYMLRTITTGYIFIWERQHGWQVFAATASGQFKQIPVADDERPQQPPSFACNRQGHQLDASLINIPFPDQIEEQTWIGYSRVWWTRPIRKALADSPTRRRQLMLQIDAKAISHGAEPDPALGWRIDPHGTTLEQHILEYRDPDRASVLYAATKTIPGAAVTALDRRHQSEPLAATLRYWNPRGGIALALRDPIGLVQDITAWRNLCAGRLAEYQLQQQRLREHVVADLIDGLKQQWQQAGRMEEWTHRYAKHVDEDRISRLRREYAQRIQELEAPIHDAATDWATWFQSDALWNALDSYDSDDPVLAHQLEQDLADCMDGAGASQPEQPALDRVLADTTEGRHRALWLAISGGDKSLLQFLQDKVGPSEQLDLVKNLREVGTSFKEWQHQRRTHGEPPAPSDNTAVIARTLASQLTRWVTQHPPLMPVLGTRITLILAARMSLQITPYSYTLNTRQLVYELHEAAWDTAREAVVNTQILSRYQRSDFSLRGSWISTQIEAETQIKITTWIPDPILDEIQPQTMAAGMAASLSASPQAALHAPMPTPLQGLARWVRTLDAKLVGLGSLLALANLSSALDAYHQAAANSDKHGRHNALLGITSGFMGLSASLLEATGGIYAARIIPSMTKEHATLMLIKSTVSRLIGGALSATVSISEGINLLNKAYSLYKNNDTDAATDNRNAAISFILSGLTSIAASIVSAKIALSTAGITAASDGALAGIVAAGEALSFIPVWGWILLGIGALAIGIYFLFKGKQDEDNALEIWMSRCILRRPAVMLPAARSPYPDLNAEIAGFRLAIFGLRIEFHWARELGRDRLTVKALLPGYGARSAHAYSLTLANGRKHLLIGQDTSPLSSDPALQPQPAAGHIAQAMPMPAGSWLERQATRLDAYVREQPSHTGWQEAWQGLRHWQRQQQDPVHSTAGDDQPLIRFRQMDGYAELVAELLIDEQLFQQATLKLEYWPDVLSLPQLKMTPGPRGLNYRLVGRG